MRRQEASITLASNPNPSLKGQPVVFSGSVIPEPPKIVAIRVETRATVLVDFDRETVVVNLEKC